MSQSPKKSQAQNKRTLLFIILLQCAAVALVIFASRYALQRENTDLRAKIEQSMLAKAQNWVAQLTIWYGAVSEQITQFANRDQVRLFASEAVSAGIAPGDILSESVLTEENLTLSFVTSTDLSDADQLKAQSPLLRRQFVEYANTNLFAGVSLLNTAGEFYLSTHASDNLADVYPNPGETIAGALELGGLQASPVHKTGDGHLMMDMAIPVYAPLYVDSTGSEVVGVLLVSIDVTERILNYTRIAQEGSDEESSRILQTSQDGLEEIAASPDPFISLPNWSLTADRTLLFASRQLPARGDHPAMEVLSLGLPVPNLPWLVEYDFPASEAVERYEAFRKTVLVTAVLVTLAAALCLGMLWWWLVGKKERAVANEIRRLYEILNQQKQIIDSVNTTVADGIVLTDLSGRIPYSNQAFAAMAQETPASLARKTCQMITCPDLARNLSQHIAAIRQANTPLTFTDILHVQDADRHYQVACSPFRDEAGRTLGVVSVYRDISSLVQAQEKAQHMVNQTVKAFVRAIETVDPYLQGQSAQTGVLAVALAETMHLDEHIATLRTAASLSQVGMIQLPHDLLTKTGTLSAEERSRLERHVEYACNALEGIDFGLPVLNAIMQMHERLDGSGYPKHLLGPGIGMEGRILAVSATFCAMLRPRSYRQARTLTDALAILQVDPPRFDPNVVAALDAFLQTAEGQFFLKDLVES